VEAAGATTPVDRIALPTGGTMATNGRDTGRSGRLGEAHRADVIAVRTAIPVARAPTSGPGIAATRTDLGPTVGREPRIGGRVRSIRTRVRFAGRGLAHA
jgi:hypothetical protein